MRAMWPAQTLPKFPDGTVNETFWSFAVGLSLFASVAYGVLPRRLARRADLLADPQQPR